MKRLKRVLSTQNTPSWVDGICEYEVPKSIHSYYVSRKNDVGGTSDIMPDFPCGAELLLSSLDQVFDKMKQEGLNFTDTYKDTVTSILYEMLYSNDWDQFSYGCELGFSNFMSDSENDNDDKVLFTQPDDISACLHYLPIKLDITNKFTGKVTSYDLNCFIVSRQGMLCKIDKEDYIIDYHSWQGLYHAASQTIIVDCTAAEDTSAWCHELYHSLIASLKTYLTEVMYGNNEAEQLEEIAVHALTDQFSRFSFINDTFRTTVAGMDNYGCVDKLSLGGVKSKRVTLQLKKIKSSKANVADIDNCQTLADYRMHISRRVKDPNSLSRCLSDVRSRLFALRYYNYNLNKSLIRCYKLIEDNDENK